MFLISFDQLISHFAKVHKNHQQSIEKKKHSSKTEKHSTYNSIKIKSPNILTLQGLLHSTLRNHVLRLSSNMFQHVPTIKSSQEIADQIMLTCPAL